jgi:hypothetical protein
MSEGEMLRAQGENNHEQHCSDPMGKMLEPGVPRGWPGSGGVCLARLLSCLGCDYWRESGRIGSYNRLLEHQRFPGIVETAARKDQTQFAGYRAFLASAPYIFSPFKF